MQHIKLTQKTILGTDIWEQQDLLLAITEKNSLWQHLSETQKPILLYGMGDGADKIIHYLAKYGKKIDGVFASDDFVRNHEFRGFPVMNYQQAVARFGEFIVLVAFGTQKPEVIDNICRIAEEQELYAPNVPLFGQGLFDYEFVRKNQEPFQQAFEAMADAASRRTFVALCQYGVSGKIQYLMDVVAEQGEGYRLLNLHGQEVYLDLGAYNGDTLTVFLREALLGGKDVLAGHRPKLLVAGYHRNEDLFLLPNLIKQLNPAYRIYLRHHLYIPGWENNFYAV